MSDGPRYGGLIFGLQDKGDQKTRGRDFKRDKKLPPPKFSTTFTDPKFNVNYDFAIKHDLTQ